MKIRWRELPTKGWEREEIYEGFLACEFPFLVVGADLKLGAAPKYWKEKGISPFLACVHAICAAANGVPALRQRVRAGKLIEHEIIHADFTVPKGREAFEVKQVPFDPDFERFRKSADATSGLGFASPDDSAESDHFVYMSCLPWFSFTHVVQPVRTLRTDFVPRVVWGKFTDDGKVPVSIQAHHAVVDGFHVAEFFEKLEAAFAAVSP